LPYIGKIVKEKKEVVPGRRVPDTVTRQGISDCNLVFEAVANASDRLDVVPPRAELLPKVGDLDVAGARR
jgi:hypothetical protein